MYGKYTNNVPSRFIDEIESNLVENISTIQLEPKKIDTKEMYLKDNSELKLGDLINHETYGHGVIVKINGDLIDVAFKSGLKKLNKNHKSISKL